MPKEQRKRHSEDEVLKVLKEIENGSPIAAVAKSHGITDKTNYRWRDRYAEVQAGELKELQAENQRLERIFARQALEIDAYKIVAEGKW